MQNFEFDFSSSSIGSVSLSERPSEPVVFPCSRLTDDEQHLHERALASASRYAEAEAELLRVIMAVDQARLFLKFDLSSTFAYCVKHLVLSEAVTFNIYQCGAKVR